MLLEKIGTSRGNPKFIKSRSFKKFDEAAFKSELHNSNWPSTDSVYNANDYWVELKNVFLNIVDKHAIRVRNKPSPWITPESKQLIYAR